MFALRLVLIIVGLLFAGFGYAIWFKKKYNLINNFERDKSNKRLDDSYAKSVGKIEFIGGICCCVLGIIGMFLNDNFTILSYGFSIIGITSLLIINHVKFLKKMSNYNNRGE